MASAGPSPSGKKRSLDAETNLVPFIDLLSVLICFLLMTAVWTQIASVNVKQVTGSDGPVKEESKIYEAKATFLSSDRLKIEINRKGRKFKQFIATGETERDLSQSLKTQMQGFFKDAGVVNGHDVFESAMITPKSGVNYGRLVTIMDVFRDQKISNIGVIPKKQ